MTPEEWNEGVRNEAEHVEDLEFRRDVAAHLRREHWMTRFRTVVVPTLLFAAVFTCLGLALYELFGRGQVETQANLSPDDVMRFLNSPNQIWLRVPWGTVALGFGLGLLRQSAGAVAAGGGLSVLLLWTVAPVLWAGGLLGVAGTPFEFIYDPNTVLAAAAWAGLAALGGQVLRRRFGTSHRLSQG